MSIKRIKANANKQSYKPTINKFITSPQTKLSFVRHQALLALPKIFIVSGTRHCLLCQLSDKNRLSLTDPCNDLCVFAPGSACSANLLSAATNLWHIIFKHNNPHDIPNWNLIADFRIWDRWTVIRITISNCHSVMKWIDRSLVRIDRWNIYSQKQYLYTSIALISWSDIVLFRSEKSCLLL